MLTHQPPKVIKYGPGEEIFTFVETEFNEHSPNKVREVLMIQNLPVWECYNIALEPRKDYANEKFLFHGTRDADPVQMYKGEEGFNINYSGAGMQGHGLYFAVKSSYSLAYAHPKQGAVKGMFLAKVITGKSEWQTQNKKDRKEAPDGFDSVSYETNGSTVFVVYANKRAYPQYYLTYDA